MLKYIYTLMNIYYVQLIGWSKFIDEQRNLQVHITFYPGYVSHQNFMKFSCLKNMRLYE